MLPRGQSVSRDQSQQVRRDLASRLIDLQFFFDGDDNIFDYGCVILWSCEDMLFHLRIGFAWDISHS